MDKWQQRYLDLAQHVAQWSKDPSTKVGAVIIAPGNRPIGMGFNGFARGANDDELLYLDTEYKHRHVIHAETNAILNARQNLEGCDIYVTHPPCQHCAGTIIQAGICRVFCPKPTETFHARWKIEDTAMLFESSNVRFILS